MVNENNSLIKPPVLGGANSGTGSGVNNDVNRGVNSAGSFSIQMDELAKTIAEVVKIEMRKGLTNNEREVDDNLDQQLNEGETASGMDKIPDVVKGLREFSGVAGQFSSWKKSVDRILTIYEDIKGTSKYYGIINIIRNKIIGEADVVLESYNTPLSWDKISKCLTVHYADKRDLGTLEYQMTTLIQRGESISEFYQKVYQHLSLILNKLASMEMGQEAINVMTTSYREKALDTFIRGLKGDLPRLLSMREPTDLPQALYLCQKLQNVDYRVQHSHQSSFNFNSARNIPPIPPRRMQVQHNNTFYPELTHNPQKITRPNFTDFKPRTQQYLPQTNFRNNFNTPNNTNFGLNYNNNNYNYNKNNTRPEPMEVDSSVRTRNVNYQNRPQNFKRTLSNQVHPPNKNQRVFNIEDQVQTEQGVEGIEQERGATAQDEEDQLDAIDQNYFLEY